MSAQPATPLAIIRRKQVEARTGLSRSTIYALISDKKFPAPIDLGGGRAVGWLDHEISEWIEQRVKQTRTPAAT